MHYHVEDETRHDSQNGVNAPTVWQQYPSARPVSRGIEEKDDRLQAPPDIHFFVASSAALSPIILDTKLGGAPPESL